MFSWKKLGNVFNPTVSRPQPWIQEYAQCPTPFILNDKVLRVYVACRPQRGGDLQYVSYPGYVDLARDDLSRVLKVSEQPLMSLGQPGAFDEFGIMPSSFVRRGSDIYAYYTGWTRMQSVPYTLAIGVAVSRDGGETFEKVGEGPTLGLTLNEPYFVTGPVVRAVGNQWTMWYLSGRKWLHAEGKFEPVYQVAVARSSDGLHWQHDGTPILPRLSEDECQDILSPFYREGQWHAIFAHRRPSTSQGAYRLGYASSEDLHTWHRDDAKAGIAVSAEGWDSQMLCYPQVIELDGRTLMFYCGNDFGREGFGIAELTACNR
ncbi:hypothetical protein [Roseateles sp.]|jgi:hypothetical protein|uniref:hypothetical protein n=1 Tax=Roseateles sp. TaxID=1971397 RepID=UPI0037C5B9E0